jgi:hypothetical protein
MRSRWPLPSESNLSKMALAASVLRAPSACTRLWPDVLASAAMRAACVHRCPSAASQQPECALGERPWAPDHRVAQTQRPPGLLPTHSRLVRKEILFSRPKPSSWV